MAVGAKATAQRLRRRTGPTFIQRSRQVSAEQKAMWHHVTGAGRSHVKRPFFDLNDEDRTAMRDGLERLVKARLQSQGA